MALAIFRGIGAVFAALVLALALAIAVEGFSAIVHPFPADFDGSFEQMLVHVSNYPAWVLAVCGLMWGGAVLVSAWLATRIGAQRHPAHGYVVGAILLLAVIFNMSMLPYPLWFEIGMLILFPAGTYFGVMLGRKRISSIEADSGIESRNESGIDSRIESGNEKRIENGDSQ